MTYLRRAIAAALFLTLSVALPFELTRALSNFGNDALVANPSPLDANSCTWVRAHYRKPGNVLQIDLNVYGYKEPRTGCSRTSPWTNFKTNEMQIQSFLYTTAWVFCTSSSAHIIPNGGTGSGYGWGVGYNKAGSCASATTFYVTGVGTVPFGGSGTSIVSL